jgi:hypothetical protein
VVDVVPHHRLESGTLFNLLGDWPFWAASVLALLLGWLGHRRERAAGA